MLFSAIGISDAMDFDLDVDFDPTGGVCLIALKIKVSQLMDFAHIPS